MRNSWKRARLRLVVVLACTGLLSGCAYLRVPRIDPTGQRIFAEPPIVLPQGDPCGALVCPEPAPQPVLTLPASVGRPGPDRFCLKLTPRTIVQPIGSEVVLSAGVLGSDGYLRTNERVEWSISPDGVGHFVAVAKNCPAEMLLGDFTRPRKVDNTFAVTSTLRRSVTLDMGTADPCDDVCVLDGQTWVTLSSPVEGTSHVVAYAPKVSHWPDRLQEATIHWIDAGWQFPAPSINRAGTSHVLTTTVSRQSDRSPREGWRVRYEIADGPPAAFAPDGQSAVEVATDAAGQASVEIYQTEPGPGTNKVCIQVIRPRIEGTSPCEQLVVGSGSTLTTWSSPDLAVRTTAPAAAGRGTNVRYQIEVSNPGDLPAEDVVVTDDLPAALAYVSSEPPATVAGNRLEWAIGRLGAGETRLIELDCRADQLGDVTNCVDAVAAGDLTASHCATTTVADVSVDLQLTGPAQGTVGTDVTFSIVVTNLGQAATDFLTIKDRFDDGLEHAKAPSPIERKLGILAAGESQQVYVTLRPTRAGRLCHSVEVLGTGGIYAKKEICITAVEPATTPGTEPPSEPPQRSDQPSISIKKTGPTSVNVGDEAEFEIIVTNTGTQRLTGIQVVDQYAPGLVPKKAAEGHTYDAARNQFTWTLDPLEPGQTALKLAVTCQCNAAADRACNRVTVTTQEGAQDEAEVCLEVVGRTGTGATGDLTMTVVDTRDPIAVGRELTYEIDVKNRGPAADRRIAVTVTLPPGMIAVELGTSGPGVKRTIQGQTVRFDPINELAAQGTLTYRIRALTQQTGEMTIRAEATSENHPEGVLAEQRTTVFKQQP